MISLKSRQRSQLRRLFFSQRLRDIPTSGQYRCPCFLSQAEQFDVELRRDARVNIIIILSIIYDVYLFIYYFYVPDLLPKRYYMYKN